MIINFSPQRRDDALVLEKQGDTLIVNGDQFDFSNIPDGGTLPADAVDCEFIVGEISRINGELYLTILLPHGPNAPESARFPEPIQVSNDGPIQIPGGEV